MVPHPLVVLLAACTICACSAVPSWSPIYSKHSRQAMLETSPVRPFFPFLPSPLYAYKQATHGSLQYRARETRTVSSLPKIPRTQLRRGNGLFPRAAAENIALDDPRAFWCGDADCPRDAELCHKPCPSGDPESCGPGMMCYADIVNCIAPTFAGICGSSHDNGDNGSIDCCTKCNSDADCGGENPTCITVHEHIEMCKVMEDKICG